jgi:opacity protein-like surface antigen
MAGISPGEKGGGPMKAWKRRSLWAVAVLAGMTLRVAPVQAQDQSKPAANTTAVAGEQTAPAKRLIGDEPYEFSLKIYGWLPSMEGHAGLGKDGSSVNLGYGDVLSNLDTFQSYVPLDLDARLGHWGVTSDFFYFRAVASTQTGPRGGVSVGVAGQQTIWEMAGYYRIGTWALNPNLGNSISLDVLGGARYNRLGGSLDVATHRHAISVGGTQEWWDPIVGPRVNWILDERFKLFARGDVGGFGIEGCSHFTWQFIGGGDWNITKNCFLEAGYRILSTDYDTGSGINHFKYDVREGGPFIALGVKF